MIYMSLIDVIGLGVSSILMIILSKSRFHIRNGCCSYSYNEHNIDISKLSADDNDSDFDDLPVDSEDSLKTRVPPIYDPSKHKALGIYNLRTLAK